MLIACLIFYPIVVHAEKIFNYQLLAVWQADIAGAKTFPLRDGDRLVDGSGFRIHLFPEKSASFRITFHSAGEESVLWEQETLNEIILPAHNEWYKLDDKRGQEKVVLEAISKTGQILQKESVLIHHISPEITQFSRKFNNELLTQNGSVKTITSSDNVNIPLPVKPFRGIEKGFKVLEKMTAEDSLNTRGISGKEIYRKFSSAVVKILAMDNEGYLAGHGTGVIVDKRNFDSNLQTFVENKDYILTNWHVIEGVTSLGVIFKLSSGLKPKYSEMYVGNLITFDAVKDLAIIEVNSIPKNLPRVKFASIYNLDIGEKVFAIGHPGDGTAWTFTDGSISQYVEDQEWDYGQTRHRSSVIQTQTPINPGNSGGPLLSEDGLLVGINSYGSPGAQNINFAVAVNSIKDFLRSGTRVEPQPFHPARQSIDRNNDGNVDMLLYDYNQNGIVDEVWYDDDDNNKWESMLGDENENEKPDINGVDTNRDGIVDTYFYDTNEDGTADRMGLDKDQDYEIDKWIDL